MDCIFKITGNKLEVNNFWVLFKQTNIKYLVQKLVNNWFGYFKMKGNEPGNYIFRYLLKRKK